MKLVPVAVCVATLWLSSVLKAQRPVEFDDGKLTSLVAIVENDVFWQLGNNFDRNYTGGLGLQASGSFVRRAHLDAPLALFDKLSTMRRAHAASPRKYYTLSLFGTAFTPDSLNFTGVLADDRPYGSIVALSVRRVSVDDETMERAWSSELVIGALGLPVARNAQTWLHRKVRGANGTTPYDPLGWDQQISNGGEPTFLYRATYERVVAGDRAPDVRKHLQVAAGAQASVGYYTQATLLGSARLGWFDSQFWEFNPAAVGAANQNRGLGRKAATWEFFAFGALRPRVIAYNALLQGQFRQSAHTFSGSEIERLQVEWDLGLAALIRPLRLQLVWNAYPGRSADFKGPQARTHTWGSLMLLWSPRVQALGDAVPPS